MCMQQVIKKVFDNYTSVMFLRAGGAGRGRRIVTLNSGSESIDNGHGRKNELQRTEVLANIRKSGRRAKRFRAYVAGS